MKDPRQALAQARGAAAQAGGDPGVGGDPADEPWLLDDPARSSRQLMEWAIIDPDRARVYSTRRLGRPITWLKRGLVRFLRQYFGELSAQQSRFNALVAAHLMRLEARVEELERRAPEPTGESEPDSPAESPAP
jgi:hypothetical protein